MRIGFNPNKDKAKETNDFFHQIVIPVYIPHQNDYFKDSLQILKFCLESLFKTCHQKTYFTIVNNGSCQEVKKYLDELFLNKMIHEIIHTSSIGKLNSILKGIVGHSFPLITISDADVLFINDWQQKTYEIFESFPKAGAVTTTPNPKMVKYLTGLVFIDNFFSNRIKFSNVLNPKALTEFAYSIDNLVLFKDINLKKYLTIIAKNKVKAVIGSGHFVVTYNSNVFKKLENKSSDFSLGGDSEFLILDNPVQSNGFWRLATEDNFTYHLGNTLDDSMLEIFNNLKNENNINPKIPVLINHKKNIFNNYFKLFFLSKVLFKKPIWRLFLRFKGLTKLEAENY